MDEVAIHPIEGGALHHFSDHRPLNVFQLKRYLNFTKRQCTGGGDNSPSTDSSATDQLSDSANLLLKTAWYRACWRWSQSCCFVFSFIGECQMKEPIEASSLLENVDEGACVNILIPTQTLSLPRSAIQINLYFIKLQSEQHHLPTQSSRRFDANPPSGAGRKIVIIGVGASGYFIANAAISRPSSHN